ncbi:MAG: response regulator [Myxococcales bacterium]|nr:response regulator [Myxococcales bacterium]
MPKQILLVEDSVTMQKVVQITFAREDYQIVATTNVDDALAKCREQKPDIVLADASLPGKTGYELATSLRADAGLKDVPVLLMTGHFNPYDEPRAQKSGIDAHIVKPFDTQSLIDKVATLVKGRTFGATVPASVPAKPVPEAVPPVVKPVVAASAPEQRSTMMGMAPNAPAAAAPRPAPVPAGSARNAASQPGSPLVSASPSPTTEGSRMPEPVRTSASPAGIPSQVPQMPRPSLIPRAPVPAPILAALERIAARGAEYDAIAKLSAEAIQQIVWEIVPELAEVIIRAEVDRLAKERKA